MKTFLAVGCLVLTGLAVPAAQFKIGAHNFTLPDGFEIELVAGTNLAPRPIEADFDEQGRLYITDSSGSNDKVEKQLAEKPHRVVRLEDTDGDGKFDKQIVFADKMMLPEGCMWLDGSLYVAAPPSIWKLTDTNSDGVADVRVEWFQGKTLTGCANDLHGPYAGPDGWIYWCKGAFAKQTYTLPNGKEFTTRASHIFRARPDGTGIEPVMTGGMDNPVGLAFTPEGERILSGTFFQNPEGGKRDGLIHAIYGGVYGKPNDALEGHPRTGDLLPMMTHLGAAAPAGLMRYESDVLGKTFQNNLFVACFNMHKIVRCVMEPSGATYKTHDSDFLVSDNTDFHPTDILEDADGSLIVVDTGGWYKLCCPTSQLQKPDVLGGIYRVRRKDAPKLSDPRGLKLTWENISSKELANRLNDERVAVQRRAISDLRKRVDLDTHIAALQAASNPQLPLRSRLNAAWAGALVDGAKETNESVIHAAVMLASVNASDGYPINVGGPNSSHLQRALVEWKGRRPKEFAAASDLLYSAEHLMKYSESVPPIDRALEHSFIYALFENHSDLVKGGLTNRYPEVRRIALLALDMQPSELKSEQVTPLLLSTNTLLKETALWIIGHHPEWGGEMARWIQDWFKPISSTVEQSQFTDILARSAGQPEVQQQLAEMAVRPASQATALSAMARSRLAVIPVSWSAAVRSGLNSHSEPTKRLALATARSFASAKTKRPNLTETLLGFASDSSQSDEARLDALATVPREIPLGSDLFYFAYIHLRTTNSVTVRLAAADVIGRESLDPEQLLSVLSAIHTANPLEIGKLLGAFRRETNETIGLALVASLGASKSLASLRPETLKPHLTNFPASVQQKADALLATLNTDSAQQKKHIDEMLASAKGGDIRRGQTLFNSPKAACSACHAIGYLGGNVGPDLTKIGQIRNERDLLEAIVYPNASFVRSYEPMIVATKGGEEYSGVLRKDAADEVVLATGPNTEQRVARNDIADMRPGTVSIMPGGLADQLTKEELADLLAFLRATRW